MVEANTYVNQQASTNHDQYSLCRAEINLDRLKQNLNVITGKVGSHVRLMAVVKSDGYGHGCVQIARAALSSGVDCLAVANLSEAVMLRDAGIESMILILGVVTPKLVSAIFKYQLTPSITSLQDVQLIQQYGQQNNLMCHVHVRIDVGQRTLGVDIKQSIQLIQAIQCMSNIMLEGMYTHLPSSYSDDLSLANKDLLEFDEIIQKLQRLGIFIPFIHAASSPAIITLPSAHYNMVRCGILMYGLPAINNQPFTPIKPIMQIKSEIVAFKQINNGSLFGYANKFVAHKQIQVAVIPFGYGDGNFMFFQQHGEVLIRGERVQIIGHSHMDHFFVDVSNIYSEIGDEVVILGEQGDETIAAVEIAERSAIGNLNSDVVCLLSRRVPRIYYEEPIG